MAPVLSREEWLAARKHFQTSVAEAAAVLERLNEERRQLPMVQVSADYQFESERGMVSLPDLFDGRRQLIIYHFMFDPEWDAGCPYCSFNVDNFGHLAHLHARDTSVVVVSRAPMSKIATFKARMGWTFPWVSSFGCNFNQDFFATLDGTADPADYMYKDRATLEAEGGYYFTNGEQGGTSVFLRDGNRIFHTFSTFDAVLDILGGTLNYLDLTPLGRQNVDVRHHDRY